MRRPGLRVAGLLASALSCIAGALLLNDELKKRSFSGTDSPTEVQESPSRPYSLRGVWSDACPCRVPCPCWHSGRAAVSQCVNVHVFIVEEARSGSRGLPGFAFVLVNLPNASGEAPSPRALYVNEEAGDDAVEVMTSFIRAVYASGGSPPAARVRMDVEISAEGQRVEIPGILEYRIRLPAGSDSPRPAPVVEEHLYGWLRDARQGVADRVQYRHGDQSHSYTGTNALVARFDFTGKR